MRALALFFVLTGCSGCPKPAPPVIVNPGPLVTVPEDLAVIEDIPFCSLETSATEDDVCLGMFTADKLACVSCSKGQGCVNEELMVYCVVDGCAFDKRCSTEPEYRPVLRGTRKLPKK